jgi:hypothetical protein
VSAGELRIEWMPYPDAATYRVNIQYEIMHPGGSASYRSFAVFEDIKQTSLSSDEILSEVDLTLHSDYLISIWAMDVDGYALSSLPLPGCSFTVGPETPAP